MANTHTPARESREASAVAPAPFYVNREQCARAVTVSPRTIDAWRERGWIPFVKAKGVVRFDLAEVKAAIERRFKVKAAPRA
jgi:hypothetical protein